MKLSGVRNVLYTRQRKARTHASVNVNGNRLTENNYKYRLSDHHHLALSTDSSGEKSDKESRPKTPKNSHIPSYTWIENYMNKESLPDNNGDYLYENVCMRARDLAKGIIGLLSTEEDSGTSDHHTYFFCPNRLTHVITSRAYWMCVNVAVLLCPSSNLSRLDHLIMDSRGCIVATTKDQERIGEEQLYGTINVGGEWGSRSIKVRGKHGSGTIIAGGEGCSGSALNAPAGF